MTQSFQAGKACVRLHHISEVLRETLSKDSELWKRPYLYLSKKIVEDPKKIENISSKTNNDDQKHS